MLLYQDGEDVDGDVLDAVVAYYEVSVDGARLDDLPIHRLNGVEVLGHDVLKAPPPFLLVADKPAQEAALARGGDENLHVPKPPNLPIDQGPDALDEDDLLRGDLLKLPGTGELNEIVNGLLDGLAFLQIAKLAPHKRPIEGLGVVVIDFVTLLKRHIGLVFVVIVHREADDVFPAKPLEDLGGDIGFAGGRAPADENEVVHGHSPIGLRLEKKEEAKRSIHPKSK